MTVIYNQFIFNNLNPYQFMLRLLQWQKDINIPLATIIPDGRSWQHPMTTLDIALP